MKRNKLWSVLAVSALIGTLAACGNEADSSGSGDGEGDGGESATGAPWILGTTDAVTSVDPAGSYDFGSWNIQYNIFQQLMTVPANGSEPEPDLAESCDYDDPQTITCTLPEGATFSNGDELTSSDVLFSFQRNIEIADPNGSSVLLGSISNGDTDNPGLADGAIETPDETTVVFHLNQPDQTFMQILTSGTTSIVDEDTFPIDDKLADDDIENMVGSGPYKLSQYKAGEQAVFEANESYQGTKTPQSAQVFVQYFSDAAPLKTAVEGGEVDIAWRTLSPTDLNSIEEGGKAEVIRGKGSEFRYWVWQLSTDVAKDKAIRQAVAQIIDRQAISDNAYDGTVAPSYSIVPPGFGGQKDSFQEKYGEPRPRRGQADPRRGGRADPGRDQARLPAGALRRERRGRGDRAGRPAELQRAVRRDDGRRGVGGVPDDHQGRGLRPLHDGLVPRLPGRRQLPVAVHP